MALLILFGKRANVAADIIRHYVRTPRTPCPPHKCGGARGAVPLADDIRRYVRRVRYCKLGFIFLSILLLFTKSSFISFTSVL